MATYQDDQGNSYASIQITWDANTELDLAHYVVEWSRDNSDWQSTQVDSGATSCRIDGLACGEDYYFRIKAVDKAGNESSYTDVNSGSPITMSSDGTAPDEVTNLTAYSLNKAIKLTWDNPSQKDFSHVAVYRNSAGSYNGSETKVAELDGTSFTDEINTRDASFYYSLKTVDTSGNASSGSAWVEGNTDTDAPAAPSSLSVTPGTFVDADGHVIPYLQLSWTDSATADVVEHEVEIWFDLDDDADWADEDPETHRVEGSPLQISGVPGDCDYRVRVRAVDDAGFKSAWTGYETGTTPTDNAAPAAPSNAGSTGLFKAIELTWDNPSDADLAQVNIYRYGSNSFGSASKIAEVRGTKYTDEDLNVSASYYYWATAVDTSGNESASQLAFGQVSTDDTAPATPSGLSVTPGTAIDEDGHQYSQLDCSWDANSEDDFDHYELKYTIDGGTAKTVTTAETSYLLGPVQANKSYSVQIRGVDRFGNASAYSSAESGTTAKDSQAPSDPTGVSTSSLFKSILIEWDNPSDSDLAYVEVYRASDGAGTGSTKIAEVRGTSYTDELNTWDATFYYRMKAVDNSGNASSGTAWTEGNTDTTAPSAPSSLSVSSGTIEDADGKIIIYLDASWTDSSDDDVKDHEVQVWFDLDDDASYADEDPETHRVQESPLRIMGVPGDVDYRVRVRAVDDANLKSAWTGYETGTTTKDNSAPSAPTGLAVTAALKAIRIEIDEPAENDWVGTEFHVSDSDGFTPGAGTLVHVGRTTSHLHKTDDYAAKYVKVRVYDSSGNYSDYTSQGTATPSKTGNGDVDDGGLNAAKILISGAVNLDSWRHASDLTTIDGGDIYANSITLSQIDGSSLDGRAVIRSDTEPTERESGDSLQAGDIWIETDEGNRAHAWDGAAWEDAVVQHTVMDGGYIAVLRQAGDANEKVEITASGVELHQGGNKLAELASDALKIYDSSGNQIAEYGGTLWVGASSSTERMQYDSTNGLRLFNHAGDAVIEFPTGGGANISGTVAITGAVTAGDGDLTLDSDGLTLLDGAANTNSVSWEDSGGNSLGWVYCSSANMTVQVTDRYDTSYSAVMHLTAEKDASYLSSITISNYGNGSVLTFIGFSVNGDVATFYADHAALGYDLRVATGLYVGATDTEPGAGQLILDEGGDDRNQIELHSSDVTDVIDGAGLYGAISKVTDAGGGLDIVGASDDDAGIDGLAVNIRGYSELIDTDAPSTSSHGVVDIYGTKASSGSVANIDAGGVVFAVRTRRSGSNETILVVDEDGQIHADDASGGGSIGSFDEYDDAMLVRAATRELAPDQVIQSRFDDWVQYNRESLENAKLVTFNENGHHFVNLNQMQKLHSGAIWQLFKALELAKQEIVRLGGDPAQMALPVQ